MKKKKVTVKSGRPSDADKSNKREHLISEARRELIRTGGTNFSMNNVLKAAGGSKTTLYSYFGDREGLLNEVLKAIVAEAFAPGDDEGISLSPKETLKKIGAQTYKAVLSTEALALYRMSICEAHNTPSLASAFLKSGPAIAREILCNVFSEFHGQKKLNIKKPELAADFFFGLLLETPLLYRMLNIRQKNEDLEDRLNEAVEVFIKAYR